ncbi:MAG: tripartite tricarboxylate transporter substrate-binding protein [Deltaproteobacteria bacterium]|nr:tripartite tricarboxylate transporter substrate-binding protein [Deltaproteobacteria bacterium]
MNYRLTSVAILACLALLVSASPRADAETPYSKGTRIRLIIPFSPGGGTDVYGRVVARHLSRHIAGNPTIIVQNMPGAGGTIAFNFLHHSAKPDGLTLGVSSSGTLTRQQLGYKGARYDLAKMPIISVAGFGLITYVGAHVGARSLGELLKLDLGRPLVMADTSRESSTAIRRTVVFKAILKDVASKQVYGYPGYSDVAAAIQRGEADISGMTAPGFNATVRPAVKEGKAFVLYHSGLLDAQGNIIRDPAAAEYPTFEEEYRKVFGKSPSGIAWEAFKSLVVAGGNFEKGLFAPPGTPQATIDLLADAVGKMLEDPRYIADAKKIFGARIKTFVGADAAKILEGAMNASPEVQSFLKELLKQG